MSKKYFYGLPALFLLGACTHQAGVKGDGQAALPATPQAQAEVHNAPDYVGAGVESMPTAATTEYMSRAYQALSKALSENSANQGQLTQMPDGSIRLQFANMQMFETSSAQIRSAALDTCVKLAKVAQTFDKTVTHIVATGEDAVPAQFSQSLADRRAAALEAYLGAQGLDERRLRDEGARSAKAAGVVILIKPIIAGAELQAWMSPT